MSHVSITDGATVYIGREATNIVRMITLMHGLRLEVRGMRLTRGRTCYAIVKQEYGLKGNKQRVLDQFQEILDEAEAQIEVRDERTKEVTA